MLKLLVALVMMLAAVSDGKAEGFGQNYGINQIDQRNQTNQTDQPYLGNLSANPYLYESA